MRKRVISIIILCLAILFTYILIGCGNKADKTFEQTIGERLKSISNPKDTKLALSSNPYDYIKGLDSNEDYKYIVSQGEKSLNYMLDRFESSSDNGLEEYIMAIACSEILKEDPEDKKWSSGREWYYNYTKIDK
jgi:hypothetical protein